MKTDAPPDPERKQIATLVQTLFKHAAKGTYVSLRSFPDDNSTKPFEINCIQVDDRSRVVEAAWQQAQRAAKAERKIVFCPPIATFDNKQRAGKNDVVDGLVLTAECDKNLNRLVTRWKGCSDQQHWSWKAAASGLIPKPANWKPSSTCIGC